MCSIHGCSDSVSTKPKPEISDFERRRFIKGAIALPLATILAYPDLTRAAAGTTTPLRVKMSSGKEVKGVLAVPTKTPAPTILLVHEWWGLNDQIKSVAAEFAKQGFMAVAIDLYDGQVTNSGAKARQLMRQVDHRQATDQLKTMAAWLRNHQDSTGKIGTIGWCFGGGWSLNCSLSTPVDATVIYYGNVKKSAQQLTSLKGPVLGHFATNDNWIDRPMVEGFEEEMKQAGKHDLTVYWYEAGHAFANPTGARYDEKDAALAWQRTLEFFKQNLI
jgi:carboxymethylenebutenolidase